MSSDDEQIKTDQSLASDAVGGLAYSAAHLDRAGEARLWHLSSDIAGGARFADAWAYATGTGVLIGLVDEGVNYRHGDLAGAYDASLDYDPRDAGDAMDALPDSATAKHGTNVAGLIVGDMSNDIGTIGGAQDATLTASHLRYGASFDIADLAKIMAHQVTVDVSNNSWGYSGAFADNFSNSSFAAVVDGLKHAVSEGRDGLGASFVFAAGNSKLMQNGVSIGDDVNFHSFLNTRFGVTVGAHDKAGAPTAFSTPGASVLLTAPGISLRTTDGAGDGDTGYASVSGTSFAAPLVSSTIALMLSQNPLLGYRDVQEILVLSAGSRIGGKATENGATFYNGGGLMFDREGGFGTLDAEAAVNLARNWTAQSTFANEQHLEVSFNPAVTPDKTFAAFETELVSADGRGFSIDHVALEVDLYDRGMRDLSIALVSPDGTRTAITDSMKYVGSRSTLKFDFGSVANWGEDAFGVWRVEFSHAKAPATFMAFDVRLHVYGDWDLADDIHYVTSSFAGLAAVDAGRAIFDDADGGVDTLNFAAARSGATIDLSGETQSSHASVEITLKGAFENVVGSTKADVVLGSEVANRLAGDYGNDTLSGKDGGDVLHGGAGSDRLAGGRGDDTIDGGAGDDVILGGDGSDVIEGGDGLDQVVFDGRFSDYAISAEDGVLSFADTDGAVDVLSGVELVSFGGFLVDIGAALDAILFDRGPDITAFTAAGAPVDGAVRVSAGCGAATEIARLTASDPNLVAGDELTFTLTDRDGVHCSAPISLVLVSANTVAVVVDGPLAGMGCGLHEFVVRVTDSANHVVLQDFALQIEAVNQAPGGTAAQSVEMEQGATDAPLGIVGLVDPEGETLTYTVTTLPTAGSVRLGGVAITANQALTAAQVAALTYTAPDDQADPFTLQFSVSDGLNSTPLTVTLDVQDGVSIVYTGDGAANRLDGAFGNDTVFGLGGNDTLLGGSGVDQLYAGAGADDVDGGTGFDYVRYDDAAYGSLTISLADESQNTGAAAGDVYTSVEGVYAGSGNDIVSGDAAANVLIGLNGADALYGGLGADVLNGGAGIDYARYDDANYGNLRISLASTAGNTGAAQGDSFVAIEGIIAGAGNDVVGGNDGINYLYGGGGNDTIVGNGGNDLLSGGAGQDVFVFTLAASAANIDRVLDFNVADDTIQLQKGVFAKLFHTGGLKDVAFHVGAAAADANDRIIYDNTSGKLFYDEDGLGGAAARQFAAVTAGLALTGADFLVA